MNIEKYQHTKKGKYNVFLSNGEVITLDERVITENELLIKKEISKDLYDKLKKENRIYELIDISIKYISIRLRSTKELRDYLNKKEKSPELIDKVVNRLTYLGYLDDEKFTKAFIKDKMTLTSMGDYKIRTELKRLGVPSDIIENNISLIDDIFLDQKICKIIEKDIKTYKKYSGTILKNKIYNHLVSKGFSKDKVINILNNYQF